ncbi:ribosome small subunit-dependent GTPase A [soil metagenome]
MRAELSGLLRHESARDDLPAVGDWVAFRREVGDHAIVHAVLPRSSALRRGLAGGTTEAQIVAANVDFVLLVMALDGDLNPRRLERYLTVVCSSGAEAIVVLTKADAAVQSDGFVAEVRAVTRSPVIVTSSVTGDGIADVRALFEGHRTGVLVGSSGVGKSTLANALLEAPVLATGATDGDGRGRHTTTSRELVLLSTGGILIDTPGMRELRLFGDEADLAQSFDDVAALALECRFRDCAHEDEPDCGVRGSLDEERYRSYHKLRRELATVAVRKDARALSEQKRNMKVLLRAHRERNKTRGRS